MKTKRQIQNLKEALVWWQTVPEANVMPNLLSWGGIQTSCATVACFGGWCARWPGLRSQGLHLDSDGWPQLGKHLGTSAGEILFGSWAIWAPRGDHSADVGFEGSDHALVTNRIRWELPAA